MKLSKFLLNSWQLLTFLAIPCIAQPIFAQNLISPDRSLGPESSRITGKTGKQHVDLIHGGAKRGNALFHSFKDFNVAVDGEAIFVNPKGVNSILTRVTGPSRSEILGTLGVEGNANLVLLNPNGVYFGPQSRVDIAGSLFVSSDSALDLGEGVLFHADTSPVPSLLTMRVPIGVQLGGNSAAVESRGILRSAQDLTLSGDRLNLSGEILAGRDLSLQGNRILIREQDRAFMGAAGRTLRIEGHDRVDIDVLQFPESGLFSGENLLLRSTQPIVADAHFSAGQHLHFEGWEGGVGDVISRTDPVVLAKGDVTLGRYEGASLHILAGGSVNIKDVTITGSGPIESTINPQNQAQVNDELTYGDLASFEVSGFELRKNKQGSLDRIPTRETITVNGHQQATLDIRAGVDWEALGGLPSNLILGEVPTINIDSKTNSSISIDRIEINSSGGQVLLTNRFSPNTELDPGSITTQRIVTRVKDIELDGGNVSIIGRGNIYNSFINTSSSSEIGNSGNAGHIKISSRTGNITNKSLQAFSSSATGNSGQGGDVTIASNTGEIHNEKLITRSISNNRTQKHESTSPGQAGGIEISSSLGNITNIELLAEARSSVSNSGQGGEIRIFSDAGTIYNQKLRTQSGARNGNPGKGGNIYISSNTGDIENINLLAESRSRYGDSAQGGNIYISSNLGNIENTNLRAESSTRDGISGQGGHIKISSLTGDIKIKDRVTTFSFSDKEKADNAGNILVESKKGSIAGPDLNSQQPMFQAFSIGQKGSGKGGNISLLSNMVSDLELFTFSSSGESGNLRITGQGKSLLIKNLEATASSVLNIDPFESHDTIEINTDNINGKSGSIFIQSSGQTRLENVKLNSDANGDLTAGNIRIKSLGPLFLNNSLVSTQANGIGRAGNINVTANDLVLNNSQLTATASNAEAEINTLQGNININVGDNQNFLLLKGNSKISTEGFNQAKGGNININSRKNPAEFILGFPATGDGNDIIANAFGGAGGNINLNSKYILGFTRSRPDNTKTNNINASSATNTQGTITLNTIDVDPNDNKPPLPTSFNPPLVANTCHPGQSNSFSLIAKGGKTPEGDDTIRQFWDDSRPILSLESPANTSKRPQTAHQDQSISEATAWIQNTDGNIQFIAPDTNQSAIAPAPSPCKSS